MTKLNILAGLAAALLAWQAQAADKLRIGVSDSDSAPIVVLSSNGQQLKSGLSRDLGELVAQDLGRQAVFSVLPRKRVESLLESGRVDVVCNANPEWYGNAARLGWTHEIYPQVERLISLSTVPDIRATDELLGRRIATIQGYSYPTLERLWGREGTQRVEQPQLDLLLKTVLLKVSDVAINSELEFAAWARAHAQEAHQLKLHPMLVTTLPTMCAVSPRATVSVAQLNQAIDRLQKQGRIKAMLEPYQWKPTR